MTNKDWASKLLNAAYFLHKNAQDAEWLIASTRSDVGHNVGGNAVLLFLLKAHPDKAEEWTRRYRYHIERAQEIIDHTTSDHVGWNDYYMVEWLITGSDEALAGIARQLEKVTTMLPSRRFGMTSVGDLARWMVESMRGQCPEFARRFAAFRAPALQEGAKP